MRDAEAESLAMPDADQGDKPRSDSLLAGVTRSAASTLRQLGISSAALGDIFANALGSLAAKHGPDESVVSDQRVHNSVDKTPKLSSRIAATIKLTLEGFASFGIYDILMNQDWFFPRKEISGELKSDLLLQRRNSLRDCSTVEGIHRSMDASPVLAHFIAGALAGLAQSLIMDVWEINAYWWNHMRNQSFLVTLRNVNLHLLYRRLVHSAASHATLFGSYEVFHRALLQAVVDLLNSYPTTVWIHELDKYGLIFKGEDGIYDTAVIPMSTTFLAGGLAGQAHAIFGHYASHWKMRNHSQKGNSCWDEYQEVLLCDWSPEAFSHLPSHSPSLSTERI